MTVYVDYGTMLVANGLVSIPKDIANVDYQRVLAEVAAGTSTIVPYMPPPPTLADILFPTDQPMIRVIEDVVEAIPDLFEKLPKEAQEKINKRRELRGQPPLP